MNHMLIITVHLVVRNSHTITYVIFKVIFKLPPCDLEHLVGNVPVHHVDKVLILVSVDLQLSGL